MSDLGTPPASDSGPARFALAAILAAVLTCVGAMFVPVRSPYLQSEILAYKIAEDLVGRGANPYDPATVLSEWQTRTGIDAPEVMMVWNPPVVFLYPGVFLQLPESLVYAVWPFLNVSAAAILGLIGWKLASAKTLRVVPLIVASFCSAPLIIEFQIAQLSSLVALPPMVGILLFLKRRDFLAGLFFSLAILKPHLLFLPLIAVGYWTVFERRWKIVAGTVIGLGASLLAAEVVFPGISWQWLTRETWPVNYAGATLASMIRAIMSLQGFPDPIFLSAFLPVIGAVGLGLVLFRKARHPSIVPLMWSLLLNQVFSPYGFIFDQCVLIVVQAFLASRAPTVMHAARLLIFMMLANVLPTVTSLVAPTWLGFLWWGVYPPALAMIFLYDRSPNIPPAVS